MTKRILIAGKGSYIGESLLRYLNQWDNDYLTECLDMIGEKWIQHDFTGYDAVCMVAGIAHIKETAENRPLFYAVNRDLAVQVAQRAKASGVKQFVYLSSMSVYGKQQGVITVNTPLRPKSAYGDSKAQAEKMLQALQDENFTVAILRPPMVYGKGCKGNFNTLEKLALKLPFFPRVKNQRSMIYIDNLSECLRLTINRQLSGIICPQNREYICTYDMAQAICRAHGKRRLPGYLTGIVIRCCGGFIPVFTKAFGTLVYQDIDRMDYQYNIISFEDSIRAMYQH